MKYSILLLLLGCASSRPKVERPPDLQKLGVVILTVHCPTMPVKDRILGSGVVISERKVVTAAHVVNCLFSEIKALQPGGVPFEMKVEMVDFALDVSRLVLTKKQDQLTNFSPIVIGHVKYGDQVCIDTAFPTHDRRCGPVEDISSSWISSSTNVEPGNSGSPMYDSLGRLVGIVTNSRRGLSGIPVGCAAVPVEGREWILR